MGCSDPPSPPPLARANGSLAPHVEWAREDAPVSRPVALFVDTPGGPLDTIASNSDVATFLNDRFHPVFRRAAAGAAPTLHFYSADGCLLAGPLAPTSPESFIALANEVVQKPDAVGHSATFFSLACPR